MRTSYFIITLVFLVLLSAVIFIWQNTLYRVPSFVTEPQPPSSSLSPSQPTLKRPIVRSTDPVMGNPEAPLAIVEFGDFQCGACADMAPVLKEIVQKYPEKVKVIWKDAPNSGLYREAWQASLAGRCAAEQNKFWEYADGLFANKNQLSKNLYLQLASQLNLDTASFEECLNSQRWDSAIQADFNEAVALGIDSTPYIFIGEKKFSGVISLEELEKIIEGQ